MRKTFTLWSIPKDKKAKHMLSDQSRGKLSIKLTGRETVHADVKLTSGVECPAVKKISDEIRSAAAQNPNGSVRFTLKLSTDLRPKKAIRVLQDRTGKAKLPSIAEIEAKLTKARSTRTVTARVRSGAVVRFALDRAKGRCELCRRHAPFKRANGTPYLEVHHLELLSENGLDGSKNVAAICPNCHREAHYGDPAFFAVKASQSILFSTR